MTIIEAVVVMGLLGIALLLIVCISLEIRKINTILNSRKEGIQRLRRLMLQIPPQKSGLPNEEEPPGS